MRLPRVDSAGGTDTLTYNAANMLLTKNGSGYTNDTNGNTLTGGGRTLTWDGQNRLTQCVNNGTTTTHTYGSDGLRRRTVQGSTTTDFILDGSSVVRTLTNGVLDRTFLHGARGPEYERIGANAPGWYAYDGLGSVLGIVDAGRNLTSVRRYDVYGGVPDLRGSAGRSTTGTIRGLEWNSELTGGTTMRDRSLFASTPHFVTWTVAAAAFGGHVASGCASSLEMTCRWVGFFFAIVCWLAAATDFVFCIIGRRR